MPGIVTGFNIKNKHETKLDAFKSNVLLIKYFYTGHIAKSYK